MFIFYSVSSFNWGNVLNRFYGIEYLRYFGSCRVNETDDCQYYLREWVNQCG